MLPPSWTCTALYRVHKWLRLAWAGREKRHADELNPGSFAVVQLYHIHDFGRPGAPHTYREGWGLSVVPKEFGEVEFQPVYRGPIFNRWGGTSRDWDPLFRVPVFVCTIDEDYKHEDGTPMDIGDVYSGAFLETIRYWLVPIQRRIREANREAGKDLVRETEDLSNEMTDFLWHEASKTDQTYVTMAKKFARKELSSLEKAEERQHRLEHYFDI